MLLMQLNHDDGSYSIIPEKSDTYPMIKKYKFERTKRILFPFFLLSSCLFLAAYFYSSNTEPVKKFTDLQVNVFKSSVDRKSTMDKDGPVTFLDRQNLDCGPVNGVMSGFKLIQTAGNVGFQYSCIHFQGFNQVEKFNKFTDSSGFGGIEVLSNHHVICDKNSILTQWKGVTEAGAFFISYSCKSFDVQEYTCKDRYSEYAPPGPKNTLIYLDRHPLQCQDTEAIKGWEGQYVNEKIRLHAICCTAVSYSPSFSPSPLPTMKPSQEPSYEPTFVPTIPPSLRPSYTPTPEPSIQPTQKGSSLLPSKQPSTIPRAASTSEPTFEPSNGPTLEPSIEPTYAPTLEPSPKPTEEPTITFKPTLIYEPTFKPSQSKSKSKSKPNPKSKEALLHPPTSPTARTSGSPTYLPEPKLVLSKEGADNDPSPSKSPTAKPIKPQIAYKQADICAIMFIKNVTSEIVPSGCALFAKHNFDWLLNGQGTPAFYVCAKTGTEVRVKEDDLLTHGLVGKDGKSMLTTIIPGEGTLVTFFSLDWWRGLQHSYTDDYHPELSHFHFIGSKDLKVEHEHVRSAIVKSASRLDVQYPSQCKAE